MLGIIVNRTQQRLSRASRFAAALFPVAQGAELYVDHGRELGLGEASGLADLFHLQGVHGEFSGRLPFAAVNFVHLLGAFQQLVEELALGDYPHRSLICVIPLQPSHPEHSSAETAAARPQRKACKIRAHTSTARASRELKKGSNPLLTFPTKALPSQSFSRPSGPTATSTPR